MVGDFGKHGLGRHRDRRLNIIGPCLNSFRVPLPGDFDLAGVCPGRTPSDRPSLGNVAFGEGDDIAVLGKIPLHGEAERGVRVLQRYESVEAGPFCGADHSFGQLAEALARGIRGGHLERAELGIRPCGRIEILARGVHVREEVEIFHDAALLLFRVRAPGSSSIFHGSDDISRAAMFGGNPGKHRLILVVVPGNGVFVGVAKGERLAPAFEGGWGIRRGQEPGLNDLARCQMGNGNRRCIKNRPGTGDFLRRIQQIQKIVCR